MVSYNWVERYNEVDFLVRFYRWLGKNIMPWYKNGMKRRSISNRFNSYSVSLSSNRYYFWSWKKKWKKKKRRTITKEKYITIATLVGKNCPRTQTVVKITRGKYSDNIVTRKLDRSKEVTLSNDRTFYAKYKRVRINSPPNNVKIKRRY